MGSWKSEEKEKKKRSYLFSHLVLGLDVLVPEELLQRFLLLSITNDANDQHFGFESQKERTRNRKKRSPVDVAELMLSQPTLQRDRNVKRPARRHGPTHPRHGDDLDVVERDVRGRLGYEHEALVETEQVSLVGLDGALDAGLLVVAAEILRGRHDLLAAQGSEDGGHGGVDGGLVVHLQLVLVVALQHLGRHVEVDGDFLLALELHDDEGVAGLALAEGRVQADGDEVVDVVRFGEEHEFFNVVVLDLVVVRLAAEPEVLLV